MNRGLVFFLGIITGVLLTIAAAFIINKSSSASGITMFNERGKMMDATSYTIIQTIDNNHGLAVGDFLDLLNPVLVLGSKERHWRLTGYRESYTESVTIWKRNFVFFGTFEVLEAGHYGNKKATNH